MSDPFAAWDAAVADDNIRRGIDPHPMGPPRHLNRGQAADEAEIAQADAARDAADARDAAKDQQIIADHRSTMTAEQAREILEREEREEGPGDAADWHRYSAARDLIAERDHGVGCRDARWDGERYQQDARSHGGRQR